MGICLFTKYTFGASTNLGNMTSKEEEMPSSYLMLFKTYLSFKPALDPHPRGPWNTPTHDAFPMSSAYLHLAPGSLSHGRVADLSCDCMLYLINPGVLKQRCVHQNHPRKCFQCTDIMVALFLLTLFRRYSIIPRQLYFEKTLQMILVSAYPSFTSHHTWGILAFFIL